MERSSQVYCRATLGYPDKLELCVVSSPVEAFGSDSPRIKALGQKCREYPSTTKSIPGVWCGEDAVGLP